MHWLIKNAVSSLLLFPCNMLLLMAAGWLLRRRAPRSARVVLGFSFAGLILLSCSAVGCWLVLPLERASPSLDLDDPRLADRADAIVVLGAGRNIDSQDYHRDMVSVSGLVRLRYAADLDRLIHKPILLSGGAPDRPGKSEAELMNEALKQSFGLQAKWLEDRSANTAQNAAFSYAILHPQGVDRIFLVTHAIHMPRAQASFEQAGFKVVPAPMAYLTDEASGNSVLGWIPGAMGVVMSNEYFHERIGALWYRLLK